MLRIARGRYSEAIEKHLLSGFGGRKGGAFGMLFLSPCSRSWYIKGLTTYESSVRSLSLDLRFVEDKQKFYNFS